MSETMGATDLMTAEQFAVCATDSPTELVRGRLVDVSRPGLRHGALVARISALLSGYVRERELGLVHSGDAGHVLRRDPDTVRGADVAFIRSERVPSPLPTTWFEGAPDLAIEVVSPNDRWTDVQQKTADWLDAGAREVWLVDSEGHRVEVARRDAARESFGRGGVVASSVFPGYALSVDELFAVD